MGFLEDIFELMTIAVNKYTVSKKMDQLTKIFDAYSLLNNKEIIINNVNYTLIFNRDKEKNIDYVNAHELYCDYPYHDRKLPSHIGVKVLYAIDLQISFVFLIAYKIYNHPFFNIQKPMYVHSVNYDLNKYTFNINELRCSILF